jgi:DNA polymerase bacteriophage-type
MTIAHIDFETFSEIDLKKAGLYRYAEDKSTEILCVAFAIDDKAPCLWVPLNLTSSEREQIKTEIPNIKIFWGTHCPVELKKADQFRAHNAEFEITIGNSDTGKKINFPQTTIDQWVCTAAKAMYWGLPRDLKNACIRAGVKNKKHDFGRTIMLQLCKPRKPSNKDPSTRFEFKDNLDKYITLYKYNIDDVLAERDLDNFVNDIPKREQRLYQLTHKMNSRGVKLDLPSVKNAIHIKNAYKQKLTETCQELTGFRASQREKLASWLRDNGCDIPDLTAETVKIYLEHATDKLIRRVLKIRQLHEMKTPEKYTKMELAVCEDGRLHGMFMYYGAYTSRWSSLIVQLQNLFRGGKIQDIENLIQCYKSRSYELIHLLYDDVMYALSSSIRGMLMADEGKVFNCCDYSSIEGRLVAWLAGDEGKLDIYRTHGKIYEHTAAQLYNLPTDLDFLLTLKETHPIERFQGKTAELALGYQGAVGALQRSARKEGVEFTEEQALDIVRRWRKANPKTQTLWTKLENAALQAVKYPGQAFKAGKCFFRVTDQWLQVKVPSGSILNYYKPEIRDGKYGEKVTYMGIDTKKRNYTRVDTYGGRWTENIASKLARDIMSNGMVRLDSKGFGIVGTVHDEILSEDDRDRLDEMSREMCTLQPWAKDIPIKAAGWVGPIYKKD